jgi:hypothetical protein
VLRVGRSVLFSKTLTATRPATKAAGDEHGDVNQV